jgi:hypothetical protein
MDYKYIEQLIERYWNAETTSEEESILRTFFSQEQIPAEMEHLRALFTDEAAGQTLDDDFDTRIMEMIQAESDGQQESETKRVVKAREVSLLQQMKPLFKAAAVVAVIITLGGALQAPWDNNWNSPEDYANIRQNIDTVAAVQPVQAGNFHDAANVDSTGMSTATLPKN